MNTITIMQYVLYCLEFIACLTGFIYWRKIRGSFWKWFPFYLAFIVLAEMTGNYLNQTKEYHLKRNIFNYIVIPAEFLFLYWLYYKNALQRNAKRIVIICVAAYVISFIIDQLYFNGKKLFFDSFSYSIGNLSLTIIIVSFFIQFARSNEIIYFKSSIPFWVSLGLLIFYVGTLPYFGLLRLLYREYKEIYMIYTYLMFVCNWLMYSLFTIAFICGKPR